MQAEDRILDPRESSDFKGQSFSGFKASEVVKKLRQACEDRSVEEACYWTAELVCAGHFVKLWETLTIIVGERHAVSSPRTPILFAIRFADFKKIVESGFGGQELELRNSPMVRKIFSEITVLLCTSKRQHALQAVTISPKKDFDLTNLSRRLEAPNTEFAKPVFRNGDPQELFVAINELCFHLQPPHVSGVSACYWAEWISAFAKHCSANKRKIKALTRSSIPVPDSMNTDPIWMVWEAIQRAARAKGDMSLRVIDSLLALYCIRYTAGVRQRRRPLLYAAISIATQTIDFSVPVMSDPAAIQTMVTKALSVYRQVRKNEVTHISTREGGRTNREKTAEKLMKMREIMDEKARRPQ